jgi:hypothetical protein
MESAKSAAGGEVCNPTPRPSWQHSNGHLAKAYVPDLMLKVLSFPGPILACNRRRYEPYLERSRKFHFVERSLRYH